MNDRESVWPSTGCHTPSLAVSPGISYELPFDHVLHPPRRSRRSIRIYVPRSYNAAKPMPLVFDLPGRSGTALESACDSGLTFVSKQTQAFIVAHLSPRDDPGADGYTWHYNGSCQNGGISCHDGAKHCATTNHHCTACDWTTCVDDVAYIEAIHDRFEKFLCIDRRRLYHTGFSSGGTMALQTGASLSYRLAAVFATAGGVAWGWPIVPTHPITLVTLAGLHDIRIPANNSFRNRALALSRIGSDGPRLLAMLGSSMDWTYDPRSKYFYQTMNKTFKTWSTVIKCDGHAHHYPTLYDGLHRLYCMSECTNDRLIRCSWDGGHNYFGNLHPNGNYTYKCNPADPSVNGQHGHLVWQALSRHVKMS